MAKNNYVVRFGSELAYRDGGWKCHYCGRELTPAYKQTETNAPDMACVDHLMPLSRGGTDDLDNLALCCKSCNSSKGTKTLEEFTHWKWMRQLDIDDPLIQIRFSELRALIDRLYELKQALGGER